MTAHPDLTPEQQASAWHIRQAIWGTGDDDEVAGAEQELDSLIAALRASRAEVERLLAEKVARMANHKGQHSWVLDVVHERSCYECGHHVCDGEGEQRGRSGWVHSACMSD